MSLSPSAVHQLNDASSKEHLDDQAVTGRDFALQEINFLPSREVHTVIHVTAELTDSFLESHNDESNKPLISHQFSPKENGIDESSPLDQMTESHHEDGQPPVQLKPLTSSPHASSNTLENIPIEPEEALREDEIDKEFLASCMLIEPGIIKVDPFEMKQGVYRDLVNLIKNLPKDIKQIYITKLKILSMNMNKLDLENADKEKLAGFEASYSKIIKLLSDSDISNDIKMLSILQWCEGEQLPNGNLALLTLSCARKGYLEPLRQVRKLICEQMKQYLKAQNLTEDEYVWATFRLAKLCGNLVAQPPKQQLGYNANKKVLQIVEKLKENQSVWFSNGRQATLLLEKLSESEEESEVVELKGEIGLVRKLEVFTDTQFSVENYQPNYLVTASKTGDGLKQRLCQLLGIWYVVSSDNEVSELTCKSVFNTVISDKRDKREIYLQLIYKAESIQELNELLDGFTFESQNPVIQANVKQRVIEQLEKLQKGKHWAYQVSDLQALTYLQLKEEVKNEVALQAVEENINLKNLSFALNNNVFAGYSSFQKQRLERCSQMLHRVFKGDCKAAHQIYKGSCLAESESSHHEKSISWLKSQYLEFVKLEIKQAVNLSDLTKVIKERCIADILSPVSKSCESLLEQRLNAFLNDGSLTLLLLCNALDINDNHCLYPLLDRLLASVVMRDIGVIQKQNRENTSVRVDKLCQLMVKINQARINCQTRDYNHRVVASELVNECMHCTLAKENLKKQLVTSSTLMTFFLESFYVSWMKEPVYDNLPFLDENTLSQARSRYDTQQLTSPQQNPEMERPKLTETNLDFYLMMLIADVNEAHWSQCEQALKDGALLIAAKLKNIRFMELLLHHSANPQSASCNQSAISHCITGGFMEGYNKLKGVMKELPDIVDSYRKESVFHKAAKSNSYEMFKQVFSDYGQSTFSSKAVSQQSHTQCLERLNFIKLSVLDIALLYEFEEAITHMAKLNVDQVPRRRYCALDSEFNPALVKTLVYVDINPFEFVICHRKSKSIRALVNGNKQLLEAQGWRGCTPLAYSAIHGDLNCTEQLLKCNPKVHTTNATGQTLLHCAAYNSDEAVFHLIWNLSELRDKKFAKSMQNPLEIALTNAKTPASTVKTILWSGAISLSASGHREMNALQYAAGFSTSLEKLDLVLQCFLNSGNINAYGTGSQSLNTALDQVRNDFGLRQVFIDKLKNNGAFKGVEVREQQRAKSDAEAKQIQLVATLQKDIRTLAWDYKKLRDEAKEELSWHNFHEYANSDTARKYRE